MYVTFLAGSNVFTLTVPVLTTYTTSLMVMEDSAMLVARMILRTPTGGLSWGEGDVCVCGGGGGEVRVG